MRVISFIMNSNTKQTTILGCLTYAASKLWNIGSYERKNWTKESGKPYPNWYQQKKTLKTDFWYKNLPSQTAQEVLKQLDEAWHSFYRLKETKGIQNPNSPRYKQEPFNLRFLNNGFVIQETRIRFPIPKQLKGYLKETKGIEDRFLYLPIPRAYRSEIKYPKAVEIIPIGRDKYKICIIIEKEKKELVDEPRDEIYMSIDLGVNNLAAC